MNEASKLKGVLIDFGDTLVYLDKEANRRYEQTLLSKLNEHGYQANLDNLSLALADTYYRSSRGETQNLSEFWKLFLKKLGVEKEQTLINDLENIRKCYMPSLFKLYQGALSALRYLSQKYKLALVSNCANGTVDSIDSLGLAKFFDAIVLSYTIGARKPDQRIYLEALRRLNLHPQECIFVADEISDLEGARALGLRTILLRQGSHTTHEAVDVNFKADFECDQISEIVRFL